MHRKVYSTCLKDFPMRNNDDIIMLDCDGCILDSNRIKVEALLKTIASKLDISVQQINSYRPVVERSFGMTRRVIFSNACQYFNVITDLKLVSDMESDYSERLSWQYENCDYTKGAKEALAALAESYRLYVVSGSNQDELRGVLGNRFDSGVLSGVYGGPVSKVENMRHILEIEGSALCMIGDSFSDYASARDTKIPFVWMSTYSLDKEKISSLALEEKFPVIQFLDELADAVVAIKCGD